MLEGTLLAESLRVGSQVRVPGLTLTQVVRQDISAWEPTARPAVRTFLDFEAADEVADELARSLAASLLPEGGWYADFAVGDDHVVVFAGKIFRYRRGDHAGRAEAVEYGRRAGVADPAEHLGATDSWEVRNDDRAGSTRNPSRQGQLVPLQVTSARPLPARPAAGSGRGFH